MQSQSTDLQPLQCRNCGAPLNLSMTECQYCHTPYTHPIPEPNLDLNFDKPSLSVRLNDGKLELTLGTGSTFSAIRCPRCGNTVRIAKFCSKCGNALPEGIPCPHCGRISKFGLHCSNCGKPLGRVVDLKRFEWHTPSDLWQTLGVDGNFSAGIGISSSPPSLAEQIKAIALGLLAQSGNNVAFDLRQQSDGELEFIVDGKSYAAVQDIPDANIRNVIQQAVAQWQKEN